MSLNLRISIVTPSFNQGRFIEETIRSVIDQDYDNLEYIVMDGGSTDDTPEIIERYGDKIAYWVSAKDAGQSDAIERGFARATGDVLAWVNSDDALAPGALAAVNAAFATGQADIVAGVVNIKQDGRLVYHHRTGCRNGRLAVEQLLDLPREWMTGRFFYQPEVFFSRDIYERAGGMIDRSLHYSMDFDLWVRCARAGARIKPIDFELANFRMHADQKTSTVAAFLPELTGHADAIRATVGLPSLGAMTRTIASKRRLRIGFVNDYGFRYGAGRAHGRLAECLAAANYEVVVYAFLSGIGAETACRFETAVEAMRRAAVDVVLLGNLHGAFPGGVDLGPLASLAPVLAVTHDFFPFTGRCPYPLGCDGYLFTCSADCPTREHYPVIAFDEIPKAHARKLANLSLPNVHLLANSAYMEEIASRLLAVKMPGVAAADRVHRLTLPVPEPVFFPGDRAAARAALGINADDFMVLTSSSDVTDRRKGFRHAVEACRLVGEPRLRLIALGWISPELQLDGITYLGHVDDDAVLARLFTAADVLVSATADETFGQVFVEAAMCGCPSIGYAVGGVRESVVPGQTGWLVERNDIGAVAARLRDLMREDDATRDSMRRRAHVYAASRWGIASFLAAINDVFRKVVPADDVEISTGAQYGGILYRPIRFLKDLGAAFGTGFHPPEGPYPEHGIDFKLQWMTAPRAVLDLHAPEAGPALLTLVLANIHVRQTISLARGDAILVSLDVPAEPWSIRHEIALALHLPAGDTALILIAEAFHKMPDRDLHLAAIDATLEPTKVADGVRTMVRHAAASVSDRLDEIGGAEPAPPTSGNAMQPDLRLHAGFHTVEGPYPEIGVPMRLAWLDASEGTLTVSVAAGATTIGLDVHLPCPQEIVVTVAGVRHAFGCLDANAWERPTCLVITVPALPAGFHALTIACAHHIVDDANRHLRLALLGTTSCRGRPAVVTERYGRPDMPRLLRWAQAEVDE